MHKDCALNKKNLTLTLFGGEATLYPEIIKKIVQYSYEKTGGRIKYHLTTNGTNLYKMQDMVIDFMKNYNFSILLSLDSDPAQKNDRSIYFGFEKYRDAITSTIGFLMEKEIRFSFRSTLISKYVDNYFDNFKYFMTLPLKYSKPYGSVSAAMFPDYITPETWNAREYKLLDKQVEQIVLYIKNYYIKHKKLITDVFTQRVLEIIFRKDVIKKKRKVHSQLCGFCGNLLAVSPDGEMYACQKVYGNEKMRIGNLLEMDINFSKIEAINAFYNNANFVKPNKKIGLQSCLDCEMVYACYNRCPAQNYNNSGGEGYYIRCNEVLYRTYKIYIKNVRKHLWELYFTDDHFKQIMEHRVGSKKKLIKR